MTQDRSSTLTCLLLHNRFRAILKKIVDTKEGMGKKMRDSSFALTEAKYAAGEFRHTVFDSVETVRSLAHFPVVHLTQTLVYGNCKQPLIPNKS